MSIKSYIKSHSAVLGLLTIVVVIGMIIAGRVATRNKAVAVNESNIPHVSLIDAVTFRGDAGTVSADGIVESASQVDLKSQTSAPISVINVSIGDTVYAGQVIAQLQNADVRAQLEQAKASLVLAQGQSSSGSASSEYAKQSAIDTIIDSYTRSDEIVHTQLDSFMQNSSSNNPQISSFITDWKLNNSIVDQRIDLETVLRDWKTSNSTLSSSSSITQIQNALSQSRTNIGKVTSILNDISKGINDSAVHVLPSDTALLNGWKNLVSAARTSANIAASNLTASEKALTGSESQITIADAGVKNLEAQLAKTIITSPITGKIAALPLRTGELATPGQLIATVIGSGGLQVKAYISQEDAPRIQKGAAVMIQGSIAGTVTRVSPSVNQSNKKIEIEIVVTSPDTSKLVVGQSVLASIKSSTNVTLNQDTKATYRLPIQDVKIVPGSAYVLTVDESSKIVKHEVTLGEVRGDFIEIKDGITDDMKIVSPVYELNDGDTVQVK